MQSISDEIRHFVERSYKDEHMDPRELLALADRIDAEMVELPRAPDGPIHLGDAVSPKDDPETSWGVRYIELCRDREPSIGIESSGVNTYRPPSCLIHKRPDSFEHIADELREFVEENDLYASQIAKLNTIADRIRTQAKERGDHE